MDLHKLAMSTVPFPSTKRKSIAQLPWRGLSGNYFFFINSHSQRTVIFNNIIRNLQPLLWRGVPIRSAKELPLSRHLRLRSRQTLEAGQDIG